MNIKANLTAIFFAASAIVAGATEKPQPALTVAVYDFTDADKNAGGFGGKVTTLVTANLTSETNLIMLERAELTKALREQAFNISGMVSSDAAAKIGQITGVKVLVSGQVIKTAENHLVIVARIIGTESGRLFTAKVDGDTNNLMSLTSDLSRKIAQTITDQTTNLVVAAQESSADRWERIIKGISGTNRPSVSISVVHINGKAWREATAEGEFGALLLKAGFTVVDSNSDRKPDVEITGGGCVSARSHHGGLYSSSYSLNVKVQERRTGSIIAFDFQESTATESGQTAASTAAAIKSVDVLAERILPLLAK